MRLASISHALAALFFLLFLSRAASADPVGRVVVVEIAGDIDDADALRSAIETELHATVVAPDDPRASSAHGTLTIEARGGDKRISATYRSLGTPVARTVDLPDDPKRARAVAVLLAGNVAREEASELLDGLKKPSGQTEPVAPKVDAAGDVQQLHAVLDELGEHARSRRKWVALASLVEGGLSIGVGTYYVLKEPAVEYTRTAGVSLLLHGGVSAAIGGILLLGPDETYEKLTTELVKLEGKTAPENVVMRVESKWAEAANQARGLRKVVGWVSIGVGVFGAGVGLGLPAIVPRGQQDDLVPTLTVGLVALSGINVALGIDALFNETAIEQSWHTYRLMKQVVRPPGAGTTASTIRPKLGFGPVAGGGMASLGFTF